MHPQFYKNLPAFQAEPQDEATGEAKQVVFSGLQSDRGLFDHEL